MTNSSTNSIVNYGQNKHFKGKCWVNPVNLIKTIPFLFITDGVGEKNTMDYVFQIETKESLFSPHN